MAASPADPLDRLVGRRLQTRGREQVRRILDAGAQVFAEQGLGAATTSAIADRAGISPGSLYQFFPNKEVIVDALALQYLEAFEAAVNDQPRVTPEMPTRTVVDAIVDPLLALHASHPGIGAILEDHDASAGWAGAAQRVHDALDDRLDQAVAGLRPDLDLQARRMTRELCTLTFKAVANRILSEPTPRADRYVDELKRMLTAYLDA